MRPRPSSFGWRSGSRRRRMIGACHGRVPIWAHEDKAEGAEAESGNETLALTPE